MNQWRQHLRNNHEHVRREQQMLEDYQDSLRVTPKEHSRKLRVENRLLLIGLAIVLVVTALALNFY